MKQREIKLRVWFRGEMREPPPMSEWDSRDGYHWSDYCTGHIMQFTGLQDKNGKDIYEGDILATSNDGSDGADVWENEMIGAVEWDQEYCGFIGIPDPDESESMYAFRYSFVIGNIYENPELMNP
jgi:uncharacterized phage protein (TIGR01671 family)